MKITNLKLKNIKSFKTADIPFENDKGQIKNWSVIAGNNGAGKTTLLRSLALGLGNVSEASGLLQELDGGFLREGENKGFVEVILKDQSNKKYKIETTIELKGNSEILFQKVFRLQNNESKVVNQDTEDNIRKKIFAIGYGSGRSIIGSKSYDEYALVDSIYSLFNYSLAILQNAELAMRRIKDSVPKEMFIRIKTSLNKILMLEDNEIILKIQGLYFKNTKWGERSFNTLSDGYQSLTTVIMDFLHWQLQYDIKNFDLTKPGIFIIDEIEQHLHPKWQRRILKILSEQFPNIQFIATTHTPICVLGLNDLECESQCIKAGYENSHSEVSRPINMKEAYKGYRVDQILLSEIFGVSSSRSLNIEDKLKKYRVIYLKDSQDRNEDEKQIMQKIEQELKDLPMWDIKKLENMLDKKVICNDKD